MRFLGRIGRLAAILIVLVPSTQVFGDDPSRKAIQADPADLARLGLKKPDGTAFTPTGAGVRIAVDEAINGVPQLNPPNDKMPGPGPLAGADGRVTILPKASNVQSDHATMVSGIIIGDKGIAPSSGIFAAGSNQIPDFLVDSQAMLLTVASGGRNASILNWSCAIPRAIPTGRASKCCGPTGPPGL